MEAIFKEISKTEFANQQSGEVLFDDTKTNIKFGVISFKKHSYKFSWRSYLVKPDIKMIEDGIYAIGIDQNFAIVDFEQNKILLNVNLTYNFNTTLLFNDYIFVCTELDVLVVSKKTHDVASSVGLPDLFVNLHFEGSKIKITCFDQRIVELELPPV